MVSIPTWKNYTTTRPWVQLFLPCSPWPLFCCKTSEIWRHINNHKIGTDVQMTCINLKLCMVTRCFKNPRDFFLFWKGPRVNIFVCSHQQMSQIILNIFLTIFQLENVKHLFRKFHYQILSHLGQILLPRVEGCLCSTIA